MADPFNADGEISDEDFHLPEDDVPENMENPEGGLEPPDGGLAPIDPNRALATLAQAAQREPPTATSKCP